jgi:hypothetical protein
MSEPTRDDLMVVRGTGGPFGVHHHLPGYTKLTDAEFDAIARKEGYVRLDVDVETLRTARGVVTAARKKPDRFGPCTCHRCLPVEGEGKP